MLYVAYWGLGGACSVSDMASECNKKEKAIQRIAFSFLL